MNLVRFKKEEINLIMEVYSRKISTGEWKDYSISFQKNYAVFSIHKSLKFVPFYQIKKKLLKKKAYSLIHNNSIILYSNTLNVIVNHLRKPSLKLVR
ncbi:MAG: hypothetical protein CMM98_04910 [Rickettsiales bacterium]|nr:hypothetical protein [Rickettsiales bacterium]|tara:strand:+ start:69 stop:359 length:291 start_codon:yes stop_codon:yes gene_type:complete